MKITKGLVEQHIHGGFGIDFLNCDENDVLLFSKKILECGVCAFCPTFASAPIDVIKKQLNVIKCAQKMQKEGAKIIGVHLEGPFINPAKKGIHDINILKIPTIENFKELEDEIIKIVTLAPELDENHELINYLNLKNIIVSAGHCTGDDLIGIKQVTHLFNAMSPISHRNPSTVLSALINDDISVELIADFVHVKKEAIKLVLKTKQTDKIILISDALPISKSKKNSMIFCSQEIFKNENCAKSKEGTLAGSVLFINETLKKLVKEGLVDFETAIKFASENPMKNLGIEINSKVIWDDDFNVISSEIY